MQYTIKQLEEKANEIREDIIKMLVCAKSGHSAGPLGMADVFTALYFGVLNYDPKNITKWDRDRFVLSCGHICPVWYATLAHAGFFPHAELATLRKLGTRLHGHPHNEVLPGSENSSGPLGQGLSQAAGMAYVGLKMKKEPWRVYCVMSDGEQQEGQIWEAAMFAGKNNLRNLTALIDRNNIQIDGYTEEVMPLEPFRAKWEAMNWTVLEVDGHNIREIIDACNKAKSIYENPTVIICHTIPGKGVDFMEYRYEWHGVPPDSGDITGSPKKGLQGHEALKELRTLGGRIRSEHE
ncbi:MAG: transketolase [Candidatus Doudnabacteria bacterium RIFCSPLOWO2_01_FULL_44_21]|uniref:Transketolase n=1 Tax=Candidatus Doudnabacteria bacterium RIFCSPLOWO2_01_FULL_44_21 TaxID=1817841 RepID=A0A1F5PXW2_9BACT|nr:MAG: transketolase [Candidatus Doudnabacteria bacterium RIFCSPHIGHO2_02_FULL_43_13b]OGE94778.1 MAG: transketolase [Candidatus Doudnabacteria bacterium RIFCSPLOWO2_01_FULL_44_21]